MEPIPPAKNGATLQSISWHQCEQIKQECLVVHAPLANGDNHGQSQSPG